MSLAFRPDSIRSLGEALDAMRQGDMPPPIWPSKPMLTAMGTLRNTDIAAALQIDPSVVTRWRLASRPIPGNRLEALLDFLRTHVSDFVVEPASRPTPPPAAELQLRQVRLHANGEVSTVGPSVYPLVWCDSAHGSGGPRRRHHHGPRPSWRLGPVVTTPEDMLR